jgi:hypothetical protein
MFQSGNERSAKRVRHRFDEQDDGERDGETRDD